MTDSPGTPSDQAAEDGSDAVVGTDTLRTDADATLSDEVAEVTLSDEDADATLSDEVADATLSDEDADATLSDEDADATLSDESLSDTTPMGGGDAPSMESAGRARSEMADGAPADHAVTVDRAMQEQTAEYKVSSGIAVAAHGTTDVGLIREQNEDFYLLGNMTTEVSFQAGDEGGLSCRAQGKGPLFIVCDGLGGAAAGEVASRMAAEVIWGEMCAAQDTDERVVYARLLRRAVRVANRRIWESGRRNSKQRGMGSTVSVAGMVGDALLVAQVGDSRAYLLRAGALVQLTRDQNLVSALVRSGRVAQSEAYLMPGSNMVLQALGVRKDVEVALSIAEVRRGDRLLLCSDGLHGPVPDDVITEVLGEDKPLETIADRLIGMAIQVGAPDNVTAVVVHFDGPGLSEPESDEPLPEYTELDPAEEGSRGMFSTSRIARRLAARIGIGEDPRPDAVPATGNFTALNRELLGLDKSDGAQRADDRRTGLDLWVRASAIAAAILAIWLLYWLLS